MKVTVKGYLHYRKYSWDTEPVYVMHTCIFDHDPDHIYIGEREFTTEIPDDFNPLPVKIEILRKEKQRIQAEAHVKAENIEQQIQELLCIEDKSCFTAS